MNSRMDGWPSEYGFNFFLFPMDDYPLTRSYYRINPSISFQVNESFGCHIIHEPADLVCMCFYNHFKFICGVDHTYRRTIGIHKILVNKWFQVFKPDLLSTAFKTYRRC